MEFYIYLSIFIFTLGALGLFFVRKHIVIILISVELILLSVNFNFLVFSSYLDDLLGELYTLLLFSIAASESAIGLAILVSYYRLKGDISVDLIDLLKG